MQRVARNGAHGARPPQDNVSSVPDAKRSNVGGSGLCVRLLLIGCGSRSGGVKFLLAAGLFSLILPLHFRPFPAHIFSLKGLIVEKPPELARIRTVHMLTIGADHPDLSVGD